MGSAAFEHRPSAISHRPSALLKNCADILSECGEYLSAEAILFRLGFSNKISHRSCAELSNEAEDCTFLNDS
jgi:hypothetical protein